METGDQHQIFDFTSLRDILTILFKHRIKIIVTCLVVFTIVTIVAFMHRKTYEAKSILLVKLGREFMRGPEAANQAPGYAIAPDTIMKGEISILTGKDLIGKVINSIGIANLYPARNGTPAGKGMSEAAAIRAFEENLSVTNVQNSTLLNVTFTHPDPYIAANVVNALVDGFKDKHLEIFGSNSTPFLKSQQETFRSKLRETESNLETFKERNRVFSFEEQRTNLIEQMGSLDASLRSAQGQISELEQKIAFTRSVKWSIDTPPELKTQLVTLQQKERELLEKYTETSRAVQLVRGEIQAARNGIKKSLEDLRQLELGKLEGELTVARARMNSLRSQLGHAQGELRALEARGRELQDLKREASQQEQNYKTYAKKFEESLIMDDMDRRKMVAISVVEKAMPPAGPKKQKLTKGQMIGAGFLGGLAAGVGLAMLLEFTASVMTTPRSAERRLGLPVVVAIARR